jgi:hypothetical protein
MLDFRRDMVTLSQKYPFVKKVIIDEKAWSKMCESFDVMLGQAKGDTEKHINLKSGSMCFEKLYVEKVDEKQ